MVTMNSFLQCIFSDSCSPNDVPHSQFTHNSLIHHTRLFDNVERFIDCGRNRQATHVSLEESLLTCVTANQVVSTVRKLILYQGNRSYGMSFQVRCIYPIYMSAARMLLHINVHNRNNQLFVVNNKCVPYIVDTHSNATSTTDNKYIVNQLRQHFDVI